MFLDDVRRFILSGSNASGTARLPGPAQSRRNLSFNRMRASGAEVLPADVNPRSRGTIQKLERFYAASLLKTVNRSTAREAAPR